MPQGGKSYHLIFKKPPLVRCAPLGVPDRERGADRCHASGAAVDVCSDVPAGAQRAERAAEGGVVDVSRARSVSPRAP